MITIFHPEIIFFCKPVNTVYGPHVAIKNGTAPYLAQCSYVLNLKDFV